MEIPLTFDEWRKAGPQAKPKVLILLRADHLYRLTNELNGHAVTAMVDGREMLASMSSLARNAREYGYENDPLRLIHRGPVFEACPINSGH
jgi:phosphatidylserine/phosphatidylglycerophosphate/cardiolipin synthase-like enzyme